MHHNPFRSTFQRHLQVTAFAVGLVTLFGCDDGTKRAAIEDANAQVQQLAEQLDKKTTDTGVYIRVNEGDMKEVDPWGTRLQVSYSQGGVAENVVVRSAGPDRRFHTDDDILGSGTAVNFKGVGEGIKKNVEQAAANTAKGVVKGTVEGVKQAVKDSLPLRRKKDGDIDNADLQDVAPADAGKNSD